MNIGSGIGLVWSRLTRGWRLLGRRLRRERAAMALLVLLILGLGEPLLCIAHCYFWLPGMLHSMEAAAHHHNHNHGIAQPGAQLLAESLSSVSNGAGGISGTEVPVMCFMDAEGTNSLPFLIPPSPVHDMVAALVICMLAPLFIAMLLRRSRGVLSSLTFAPPVPPPII